jgi:hypothetical protein
VALILKLAIAPPVELIVNPVAAVFIVLLSVDAESVKAGAARTAVTVNAKVWDALPALFVAVTV